MKKSSNKNIIFWISFKLLFLSLLWRRHHYRWRAANFDLCSAHIAFEKWGFFSVPHLLWHGESISTGHPRGPVTLIPIAKRFFGWAVTICFNDLGLSRLGFEHPTFRLRGERSNRLRHRRGFGITEGGLRMFSIPRNTLTDNSSRLRTNFFFQNKKILKMTARLLQLTCRMLSFLS